MRKRIIKALLMVCVSACAVCTVSTVALAEETEGKTAEEEVISTEPAKQDVVPQKESAAKPYEPKGETAGQAAKQRAGSEMSGNCGEDGDNISWSFAEGVLTLEGSGKMADYQRGGPWSTYDQDITEINISEGITYLGQAAFLGCNKLTEIIFPQTIQSTGQAVFCECNSLRNVTLNEGLETLPEYVFQSCAMESILLPKSLRSIDPVAFLYCRNLQACEVADGHPQFAVEDGIVFSKDRKQLLLYPQGKSQNSFTVPDGVQVIGKYAFADAVNLSSIVFPKSVTELKEGALTRSGIESLELPDSITSMEGWICDECPSLKSISIGNGLKTLGDQAFQSCNSLISIDFGNSLEDLGLLAFARCAALTEVTIPEGVKYIKNGTFGECNALRQVSLPATLEEIWYQAFFNCSSLETISLPKALKVINRQVFWGTALSEVTIPPSVTFIGKDAFPRESVLHNENQNLVRQEDGTYLVAIPVTISTEYRYKEAFQVLDLVNQERRKQGIADIKMDRELLDAAMLRAAETSIYFSHTRLTGLQCFTVSEKMYGENIAAGQATPAGAMNSWMNSDGHRGNILDANYQSIGIGAVKVDGQCYWVQCFGAGEVEEAAASAYQNKTDNTTVTISDNDEEFRPELYMYDDILEAGEVQTVSFSFHNTFCRTAINPVYVSFESSNHQVCTISEKGEMKALRAGESEIRASLKGFPQIHASETVEVINSEYGGTSARVSKLTISGLSKKIAAGKKVKLTVKVSPANASKKVKWTSGNTKVATVSSSGVVTVKKKSGGKSVTITAKATDGSGAKATYKITSMKGVVKKIIVSGKKSVKAGKTLKLKATVKASKGANKKLKWTSSNKKYASVSSSGKVKSYKAGKGKKVKITAMATDGSGKKKSITVKIK